MRGRKSSFDEERFNALLRAVGRRRAISTAAAEVGLQRRTVHRWMEKDPELRRRVLTAKAEG